jgi:hypothetical protein
MKRGFSQMKLTFSQMKPEISQMKAVFLQKKPKKRADSNAGARLMLLNMT